MLDARSTAAMASLQVLLPDLQMVRALKLAKGVCALAVHHRDDSDDDLAPPPPERMSDTEFAQKITVS